MAHRFEPFCHNDEGWGPLSNLRYDFTPCFLDVPQAAVALFGILCGGASIGWLLSTQSKQPTPKDWHYFTKLILLGAIVAITTVQGYVQITTYSGAGLDDFRAWNTLLQIAAFGTVFTLHELEHERARVASGVLLFYWLFYFLSSAIRARSFALQNHDRQEVLLTLTTMNTILAGLIFVLECFIPKKQSPYRLLGDEREYPSESSNIFSILSFGWLTPMMKYGYKNFITEHDLWDLPARNSCSSNSDRFLSKWEIQLKKPDPSIWKALFFSYGKLYLGYVPLKLVADSLGYLQPQMLRLLISFVESYRTEDPDPPMRGFMIAVGMFIISLSQSVCNNQFMNFIFEMGQTVKSGLTANIYKKSLRLSNKGRAAKGTGDIVNLMAVDTQRISDLSRQGHQLWSSPFQITLCMISLYQLLGWTGFAGMIIMMIMIPVNAWIARLMKKFQQKQMKNKDERTRVTTEILMNIKSIKLYSWTQAFSDKLADIRNNKELKTLRLIGATQAASRFCWNTTPFMVSCATFTLYVLVNKSPLSVELVFPALTLFNLLTMPLTQLPNVITSIIESTVAVARLKSFLLADEIQEDAVTHLPPAEKSGEEAVTISSAGFTWGTSVDGQVLSNIAFTARKGQLSCVVGRVGSGKSSLLQAIVGDLHKTRGNVTVKGSIAYVAQNAWIMNATVKENILFGHHFDAAYYDKTIKACALLEDLSILPDGDQTEVGEKGISLSGGQKARLQLARAVYARADVYLLDDILSAVDQHVGRHIINRVVGPRGLLKSKTRILATNSIPVLEAADDITLIKDGRIVEHGKYWDIVAQNGEIAALIRTLKSHHSDLPASPGNTTSSSSSSSSSSTPTKARSGMATDSDDDDEFLPEYAEKDPTDEKAARVSISSLRRPDASNFRKPKLGKIDVELAEISIAKPKTRQTKEISQKGKVKWSVYRAYAQACNLQAVCLWIFTIVAAQSLQVSGSVWLKNWAEINERTGGNPEIAKNVGIYFALGFASSSIIVVQTMIMWLFCTIQASKKLHERMAKAMFRSPMSFFETTPVGRILNRFSADMNRVDEAIGKSFSELFGNLVKTLATLLLICASSPIFTAVVIPLGFLYLYIQRYYLRTNRELKRLESVSRSPIYAHFSESLGGVSTIRAFKQEDRWCFENENRVDNNMKAWFPSIHANRWLGIRLEFVGSLVVFSAAALSIWSVSNGRGPSAGMVGLAMSYALQITQALNWMVRLSVEVETNIVSVERVLEYADLPAEAEDVISNNRPLPTWPSKGAIRFNDYSMRYRSGLDLVLKDISLSIKAREKIGVVGRTGAGKSSLTLSLFRIIEAASGAIDIDDLDTSTIGLQELRSKLAIIPQDAALFEGTLRDNLDPSHSKEDHELWEAIEHARLKTYIQSLPLGLLAPIQEAGSNLSQGQKQLVSLARALLTSANILILDEATAAVDVHTDALIQETLRSELFNDRTVITIAHRINTIVDCDRVVVLSKGRIVEIGSPDELMGRGRGEFFELCREAGICDQYGRR